MYKPNRVYEVAILVNGREVTRYDHEGDVYIEGRDKSNFEIEIRNHSGARIEAVVSVDGLSVTDGTPAGYESRGYLVNARGSVRIPGWTLSNKDVAAFTFSGKANSYAAQSGQDDSNVGVIGVMLFSEKYPYYDAYPKLTTFPHITHVWPTVWGANTGTTAIGGTYSTNSTSKSVERRINAASISNSVSASVNNMGTEFGDKKDYSTKDVAFSRGDELDTICVYYDNAKGLAARGIQVKPDKALAPKPNPFPNMGGCVPPAGWSR